MTYCDDVKCLIENCLRNYRVQYKLELKPLAVDKCWSKHCIFREEVCEDSVEAEHKGTQGLT